MNQSGAKTTEADITLLARVVPLVNAIDPGPLEEAPVGCPLLDTDLGMDKNGEIQRL
jgi:hypothetical protein